jgi:hypothetical protein
MQNEKENALRVGRSAAYKAHDRLKEVEELLTEATKAGGMFEGYSNNQRNALRRLILFADKVTDSLDKQIAEIREGAKK